MTNIIQKIIKNRNAIEGISLDGNFYLVNNVLIDDEEEVDDMFEDMEIITAYEVVDEGNDESYTLSYTFTVNDLTNSNVKLYRFTEI